MASYGLSPGILMLFGSLSSYLGKLMEIAELGAQPSCIERSRKIARSAAALNGDPSNKRIDLSEHLSKCVYLDPPGMLNFSPSRIGLDSSLSNTESAPAFLFFQEAPLETLPDLCSKTSHIICYDLFPFFSM